MATAKTTKSTKTTKKSPKPKAKSAPKSKAPKTVHATEPYHQAFGVILIVVGVIMVLALIAGVTAYLAKKETSDAKTFAAEYTQVSQDNLFVYKSGKEIIDILEHGTGVVFLGFSSCPWCQAYAPMLNDLAKSYGIETIYYHNTYDDWKGDTEEYRRYTEILADFLQYDNVGNRHLYVPNVAFVVDGQIIGNDWETSKDTLGLKTPAEYWTSERVDAWQSRLAPYFEQIVTATK